MSKIERVILRLGNDSATQRKFKDINKVISKEKSLWCWSKDIWCPEGLVPSDVSALTKFLSKNPTKELYVVFNIEDKTVNGTIMDPDEEFIHPSNYWINHIEYLSFDFHKTTADIEKAFIKASEGISEYTASFDAIKKSMLSFSVDTTAMKDCVEKLKKELSDEMHKNSFNI